MNSNMRTNPFSQNEESNFKDICNWTVVWVNYFSSTYMDAQLNSLYLNDPNNFKLIIIDNSCDQEEKHKVELLLENYKKYNNLEIIYNVPESNITYTSKEDFSKHIEVDQHGMALNIARDRLNTKYVLFYDLDFFWFKKDIFKYFENKFKASIRTVGAPYPLKVGFGASDFPALFGCAHFVEDIKEVNLMGEYNNKDMKDEAIKIYPKEEGYTFSLDVGYRLRKKLSFLKYRSFNQYAFPQLIKKLGNYGPGIPVVYFDRFLPIAIHLFGGNRKVEQTPIFFELNAAEVAQKNILWQYIRGNYASYLCNQKESIAMKIYFMYGCSWSYLKSLLKKNKFLMHYLLKRRIKNQLLQLKADNQ